MSTNNTNVYSDLVLPDPDGMLAKAKLVKQIDDSMNQKGLDRAQAAHLLGLEESQLKGMLDGGKFGQYPISKLLDYLKVLEVDLEEEDEDLLLEDSW